MSEQNPRHLFFSQADRNMFLSINSELLGEVIQQQIIYYAVSALNTKANIYGESDSKTFKKPVKIWALVQFDRTTTSFDTSQANRDYHVRVKLSYNDLSTKDIFPREGDFLTFGPDIYEVFTVLGPKLFAGQHVDDWDIILECRQSRINIANIQVI